MNELCRSSACQLLRWLRNGDLSCRELVDAHIAHIEKLDHKVNAIVTRTFESALQRADQLDQLPSRSHPLFGIPVAHKDLVATKGVRTTFGFPPYKDHVPDHDAWIVARMKNAGAIMVGKTNVPEFGAGSHTFNRIFGPTRNPYDLKRSVGGSSGGAAAALCSRMIPIADGSDTGGSLRNPAAFCNVIGFRPSPGRIPAGPRSESWTDLSQLGPMARNVDDLALLFSVLAGPDERSVRALDASGKEFREIEPIDLKGLRVAFTEDFGSLPVESPVRETLVKFASLMEESGAIVSVDTPPIQSARRIFHILRGLGFRRRFGSMAQRDFDELKETIRWNIDQAESLTLEDLEWAMDARFKLAERIAEFFQSYDIWLGPCTQVMPFPVEVDWVREVGDQQMENYIQWMEACSWISVTGLPALSLPAGFSGGLPVGIQVIAPFRQDLWLLRVSKAMETVSNFQSQEPPMLQQVA